MFDARTHRNARTQSVTYTQTHTKTHAYAPSSIGIVLLYVTIITIKRFIRMLETVSFPMWKIYSLARGHSNLTDCSLSLLRSLPSAIHLRAVVSV